MWPFSKKQNSRPGLQKKDNGPTIDELEAMLAKMGYPVESTPGPTPSKPVNMPKPKGNPFSAPGVIRTIKQRQQRMQQLLKEQ
jgi:hypothetical protein